MVYYVQQNGIAVPYETEEIADKDLLGAPKVQHIWKPHLVFQERDLSFSGENPEQFMNFVVQYRKVISEYLLKNRWFFYEGSRGVLYVDSQGISHKSPVEFNDFVA